MIGVEIGIAVRDGARDVVDRAHRQEVLLVRPREGLRHGAAQQEVAVEVVDEIHARKKIAVAVARAVVLRVQQIDAYLQCM